MSRYEKASGEGWEIVRGDSFGYLCDMPDASVDAVITDPPYSSGGQFRGDRQQDPLVKYVQSEAQATAAASFGGDSRDQRSFFAWCTLWLSEAQRATRPGGVLIVFSDWRQLPVMTDAIQSGGWIWRGVVPWDKVHARPVMGRFAAQAEYAIWGSNGPLTSSREIGVLGGVVRCPVLTSEKYHMTGKPVPMMRELCRIVPKDGLVLDPFMGSASTGVAALREHRRFVGIERSKEYFEISKRRLMRWQVDDVDFRDTNKIVKRSRVVA